MNPLSKTLVVTALLVLVLVGAWVFIFSRLLLMKHAYVEETKLLLEERNKELSYLSIQNILRETEEERAYLGSLFVTEDTVVSFLEKLEETGRVSGVVLELNSVKPNDSTLDFFFQVSGSFKDIYAFVKLAELLPYKIVVDKLDVKKADGFIDAMPLWTGTMTISLKSFVTNKENIENANKNS
ncbi:MAG TPA: hypothetical protein VJJ24_01710 [Candidatus Paceibacterota bacterium]